MNRVTIVGCGVVGAAIAYELSQNSSLEITVLDRQPPAQASTGAALGILMGIISQKVKGRNWRLRQASIQRYATLIPELEEETGETIQFNRHGILNLCFDTNELEKWDHLLDIRHQQGWRIERWPLERLRDRTPQLNLDQVVAGIYSPQDGQVNPTELTHALIKASQQRGVQFRFDAEVTGFERAEATVQAVQVTESDGKLSAISTDWVILASGLGTTLLTQAMDAAVPVIPVLGQAMTLQMAETLGHSAFQPVVNGNDIHIAPIGQNQYWVGATVEFPSPEVMEQELELLPVAERLEEVKQGAIAMCPALANATVLNTWSGLRPRPQGHPAPVIEWLPGSDNVLVATAHYRNGVLLAPATAQDVYAQIHQRLKQK
ncbi:MAG: NAD(P)/FAD-dependent oxidoreductase [Thainema sp.]